MSDAILVAAVSFASYIVAGFVQNAWIVLPIAIALMLGVVFIIKNVNDKTIE